MDRPCLKLEKTHKDSKKCVEIKILVGDVTLYENTVYRDSFYTHIEVDDLSKTVKKLNNFDKQIFEIFKVDDKIGSNMGVTNFSFYILNDGIQLYFDIPIGIYSNICLVKDRNLKMITALDIDNTLESISEMIEYLEIGKVKLKKNNVSLFDSGDSLFGDDDGW